MQKATLAILAAGMGSRFGGLKQIEKIDDRGHILLDYSLYDALLAGFERAIFIIGKEMKDPFLSIISSRAWYNEIEVDFVFQGSDNLPNGFSFPQSRKKPWGTAHALSCLFGKIESPFGVINADDFYGRDAISKMADFIQKKENGLVSYKLKHTLSKHGKVSRGICKTRGGYLESIVETTGILVENGIITDREGRVLSPDTNVSMNLWGFTPEIISEACGRFSDFLKNNLIENPDYCEFYLPSLVSELIYDGKIMVKVAESFERWYGVTYKKDKSEVTLALEKMTESGIYPTRL